MRLKDAQGSLARHLFLTPLSTETCCSCMSCYYILQNQHQFFLAKDKSWVDGRDSHQLFKTPHKDEAINQLFEANSRDYSLRIQTITCELDSKGRPVIDVELLPPLAAPCDLNGEKSQIDDNEAINVNEVPDEISADAENHLTQDQPVEPQEIC